ESLKSLERGTTICVDAKGELSKWLSAFDPSRIVFEQKGGKIVRISILESDLVFERVGDTWQLEGKRPFCWVDAGSMRDKALLKALGPTCSDCAICLQAESEDRLLIVPNKVRGIKKVGEAGDIHLEFEKAKLGQKKFSPIEISCTSNEVRTSCCGYLYLA